MELPKSLTMSPKYEKMLIKESTEHDIYDKFFKKDKYGREMQRDDTPLNERPHHEFTVGELELAAVFNQDNNQAIRESDNDGDDDEY